MNRKKIKGIVGYISILFLIMSLLVVCLIMVNPSNMLSVGSSTTITLLVGVVISAVITYCMGIENIVFFIKSAKKTS